MTVGDIVRVHCNACLQNTRHSIVAAFEREIEEHDGSVLAEIAYEVVQCAGCDEVAFREHGHYTGHEFDDLYPPRISRRRPLWSYLLPSGMKDLVEEIYVALHSGSSQLALMGIRALFDLLALEHVGDVGSFAKKIEALQNKGVISAKNRDGLAAIIDAGSAAAHRGYQPALAQLGEVMDILENVLQSVYALDGAATRIKRGTPPRSGSVVPPSVV